MAAPQTRIHQKVDEDEIRLVLQCKDSHEFYERYVQQFPKKRKGIESISKIWKRRSEFAKRQQQSDDSIVRVKPVSHPAPQDIGSLMAQQNRQIAELCALTREQLAVSKDILSSLKKQAVKEEPVPKRKVTGIAIQPEQGKKDPGKKKEIPKPAPILIGS